MASGGTPLAGLGDALKAVGAYLASYVVFTSEYQQTAAALWVAVTWTIEQFDVAPYLLITAPERQSGKTRLLEVLEHVVRKPILASSISPAALYRVVDKEHPTILLDEIDAIYGPKAVGNEDLRSLINAGHRRGVKSYRMGGGTKTKLESFDAFSAKALAGIDGGRHLPDTIVDRSILIRLQRRAPDEQLTRYRQREAAKEGRELAQRVDAVLAAFKIAEWPEMPIGLSDRATDVWEPLISIADAAGGEWPDTAREAAESIYGTPDPADDSLGVRLLADIRTAMKTIDRISSTELIAALVDLDEAPWSELYGKPLSQRKLADLLRPFGINSHNVRTDHGVGKGYTLGDFASPWRRYLIRMEGLPEPEPEMALFEDEEEGPSPW